MATLRARYIWTIQQVVGHLRSLRAERKGSMRGFRLVAAMACIVLVGCSSDSDSAMRAHELSLAVSPAGTFAAWHGGPAGSSIYVQKLGSDGQPEKAPVRISEGPGLAYEPDIVAGEEQLAVAWYERERRSGKLTAWLAGLSLDGRREWIVPLRAGGDHARNPVVRLIDDIIHVAWLEHASRADEPAAKICYQRFSRQGTPVGPLLQAGHASRETWNLNAGVRDGILILVYDAALGTRAHELHMIAISDGSPSHRVLSEDDGHASLYPDVQFGASGRAALTWFDERDGNQEVYLLAAEWDRLATAGTEAARRITHSPESSIGAYLAWNGDVIGLAWSDSIGGRRDLFTQHFAASGQPLGPIYRVGSSPRHAGVPAIRQHGDGFLIAWNDYFLRGDAAHLNVASSQARFAQVPIRR